MKRIIITILLFSSLISKGQIYQKISTWEEYLNRLRVTGMFRPPYNQISNADTASFYYNKTDSSYYYWSGNAYRKIVEATQLSDSTFRIGNDTITIRGTGGDSSVFATRHYVDTAKANIRDQIAGKQPTGNYITGLTGDVAAVGPDLVAATISNGAITAVKISDGAVTMAKLNTTGTPDGTKFLRDDGAWENPPGGSGQTLYSDLGPLSETKIYSPAVGVASSSNVTNYSHTSVDSARYNISTTRAGTGGSEYGAWLFNGTSGDSIKVTAPFWVVIGDSQAEGHTTPTSKHGRLHWLSSGVAQNSFKYDYPDSVGQLSYHLRSLTNMRWYNHGIGGETTVSIRRRFYRDALGVDVGADIGGRGQRTLSRKPQGVVIIAGINDIFNGVPAQVTKDNLEWMASVCQQEGIRCVILNIPGDAISTQTNLQDIASMNKWFESGVMDQYGACVVDYNSWWNDSKRDNVHHTALIADDVHPSAVGYDSLANYIYRQAKLPKLVKAVFINELDPGGFIGYSRPAAFTINSIPYAISSANDTIAINSYVPDSVSIKVTSSTNITGTTYCGFSHIEWYTTNNPLDTPYYTKRTLYSGSQKSSINAAQLKMITPTAASGYNSIDVLINDQTNHALQLLTSGAGGQLIVNGLTNTSPISSAALSVYKNTGYAIATDGNILTQGSSSQIGNLQITQNATASTTGYGISANNTTSTMRFQTTAASNKDAFRFDSWSGSNVAIGSTKTNLIALTNIGFGNASSVNQTANAVYINPTYNQTTTGNTNLAINGITYSPVITSLGNARHRGLFILSGNNYLNAVSDSTCIGCDSNSVIGAKFRVNGKAIINTIDSSASPTNMLWQDPATGEIMKAAVPTGGGITSINSDAGPAYSIVNSTGIIVTNTTGQAAISVNTNDPWLPHILDKYYTDVSNSGTSETDLYSYTIPANTLALDGQSVHFETSGTLNDPGASATFQLYFGGTSFANTGAQALSAAGNWSATGYIMRTSSSTAKAYAEIKSAQMPDKVYVFTMSMTSLDFTTTNILKTTAQAGGGGGGSNDITQTSWVVKFEPITL